MSARGDEPPHRRDPDDTVLPILMLRVEERLREERHNQTNRLAAIEATMAAAKAQAAKDHAEIRADLVELKHAVEPLPTLIERVSVLEDDETFERGRVAGVGSINRTIWKAVGLLIAFIAAMTGVLALILH